MNQQSIDAIEEARYIVKNYGCPGIGDISQGENNPKIEDVYASESRGQISSDLISLEKFKEDNIIVEKDLVLKGGNIVYPSKGRNHSESLIVISESPNLNRSYFVPKGSSYYTQQGLSIKSTKGFGENEAIRDIYLSIDGDGYSQIKEEKNQNWTLTRLGLGDKIIVKGSDVKFRNEDTEYGVYFIQNTQQAFENYKLKAVKEEAFVTKENFDIIFNILKK